MLTILLVLTFIVAVKSACDNGCSGHGTCGEQGVCTCFDNWGLGLSHLSGDCSERLCPYEIAWIDTPDKLGNHHKYAECANRGICNRDTGECECFPGYEGKGCKRTTCPNDCSGHGRCLFINDLPYGLAPADYSTGNFTEQDPITLPYYSWDKYKTRGCLCDPQYGDVDCSKRLCPFGTDVLDQRPDLLVAAKYQVQKIAFQAADTIADNAGKTFALTFRSKLNETFTTVPIPLFNGAYDYRYFILNIEKALERLPNGVIDDVDVAGSWSESTHTAYVNITFTGSAVQGPQNLVTVRAYECGDGCSPKITGLKLAAGTQNVTELQLSDFNSYECGRRGKCDYTTGVCQCFSGYNGPSCGAISCLV